MIVDSGAHINTVTEDFWKRINKSSHIFNVKYKTKLNATGYASSKLLEVIALFTSKIKIHDEKPESIEEFYVIKDAKKGLLGRHAAKRMKILLVGLEVPNVIAEISSEFPKIPNLLVKFDIDRNVQPKKGAYHKVPYPIEHLVDQKLKKLEEQKIIVRVEERAEWISRMIAVPKGDGDARLCVDMRNANEGIHKEDYPLPTIEDFTVRLRGAKFFSIIDFSNAYFHCELHPESQKMT